MVWHVMSGIKLSLPAMEAQSLNDWAAREDSESFSSIL